jgi:chemotaxis response regulator CheB
MGVNRSTNTEPNGPIRVLLADDHTMFRQGLAGVLASYGGMEVIAEVPNDEEALELAGDLSPDVVVMQVQLPFERAVQTLEAMRSFPDPPKVVIVTMFESPRYVTHGKRLCRWSANASKITRRAWPAPWAMPCRANPGRGWTE